MSDMREKNSVSEHTSQELSQRLQDTGFKGEHSHKHAIPIHKDTKPCIIGMAQTTWLEYRRNYEITLPAWTFTELWGVLPEEIEDYTHPNYMYKHGGITLIGYGGIFQSGQSHESPAEAVGLLLEWLIDNGHITLFTIKGTSIDDMEVAG